MIKDSECSHSVVLLCPSARHSWALQHIVVSSLFLQQPHQVTKAEQFRGVQLCQDCGCSLFPMPAPDCALLLFLHHLWSSLLPHESKPKHSFQEVPWAWRARRAWKVQEWVARWEWEDNKRTRGNASPGAAWLMGSLSYAPKKPIHS